VGDDQPLPVAITYPNAAAVTPNDNTDLTTPAKALFVGSVGNVTVITTNGQTVQFGNVPSGTMVQIGCTRVKAGGTSASNIVAMW
jgi:hypothetical protein